MIGISVENTVADVPTPNTYMYYTNSVLVTDKCADFNLLIAN